MLPRDDVMEKRIFTAAIMATAMSTENSIPGILEMFEVLFSTSPGVKFAISRHELFKFSERCFNVTASQRRSALKVFFARYYVTTEGLCVKLTSFVCQ